VFSTFGVTHVAMIADVSVDENDQIHVHRVVCAVNCGLAVNPDNVKAQIEGGIVFGLSAALYGEITLEGGAVQQTNFHDYPILRLDAMPEIEVHILPSESKPTGIGEMGVPPIAPAIANAIFALTGKRLRRIPFTPEALRATP
jgi:isoquinoline 1-oxidoreductase beta subunit